jgi:hypothetical protein
MRLVTALLGLALLGQAGVPQPTSRWFRLGGMVVDSHGRPPLPGSVAVTLSGPDGSESTIVDQSGQFEFVVPVPAEYRLTVAVHSFGDQTLIEYASRDLTLARGAAVPFVIVTKPAVRLAGHVTFEGEPRGDGDAVTIRAEDASGYGGAGWIDPADVDADGSFVVPAYAWARLLRPGGAAMRNRTLKAVLRNGVDVTDTPTEFAAGDRVEMIVTSRLTSLRGSVTLPGGGTADLAQVYLFAEDRAVWLPHSSRVYVTRAAMDGRYGFRAVRPGRYLVAAMPFRETVSPIDAPRKLLERVARVAAPITIDEGESRALDLIQAETAPPFAISTAASRGTTPASR